MDGSTLISFATFAWSRLLPGAKQCHAGRIRGKFWVSPHLAAYSWHSGRVLWFGCGRRAWVSALFAMMPWLYDVLKVISVLFLLYLAWKIGSAGRAITKDNDRPLSFFQAASFQLINPKAVTVITSSVTAYTSAAENVGAEVTMLLVVFAIVTICATCTWAVFGTAIAYLLTSQTRLRQFNVTMALLLVASLLPSILAPALIK